ncbi:MAG: ATP-dependent DNA helicase RecG [Flavobacteriales bacterium]|jgi:ATP-dependent DNA helicase RecG|tara:strand:+ start:296 stop:2407 length:2112 start_codon:yes stop_codon:yes gene_type:complete
MASNPHMLDTPIEFLKGVGPQRAEVLQKELHVFRYRDLLELYPFRYIDKTRFHKIAELQADLADVQIVGKIIRIKEEGVGRKKRIKAIFQDDTNSMDLVWFKGISWVRKTLKVGEDIVVFGKPTLYNSTFSISHPEIETLESHKKSLVTAMQGVYPSTEKLGVRSLHSKGISKLIHELLEQVASYIPETLSIEIRKEYKLISKREALVNVHFPQSEALLAQAHRRLKFEEFFFMQLAMLKLKQHKKETYLSYPFSKVGTHFNTFYKEQLPFELTGAQKRVLKEIRLDVATGKQMNRLVQGDVGSGKTIVALMAMLIAKDNGFQACLMAPTEILASQHFQGLKDMVEAVGMKMALLTGSTKVARRREIHAALESGELDILVGTHALLEDKVQYKNLGLAVIDEQHRFGVSQRSKMWKKNSKPPHVLVMTATPIPRTLAMAVYGDLDISLIDELPPGRKPITTFHKTDKHRLSMFHFLKQEIEKGRQIYIVYPLIEDSKTLDYKDLMDGYDSISRHFPKPQFQVSVVHGRMKAEDKEAEMARFVKGETHIMVATTVIEVGVNVPNASVMVIESAERFGLSQLHQLRGRVGRGSEQSFCVLMSGHKLSADAKTRLKTMVQTQNGFEIADVDLKLRGPGDIMGTRQSGLVNLKLADLTKDSKILQYARQIASELLDKDPEIVCVENRPILKEYMRAHHIKMQWSTIS